MATVVANVLLNLDETLAKPFRLSHLIALAEQLLAEPVGAA